MSFEAKKRDLPLSCWNCNTMTEKIACPQCGKIQEPRAQNYFTILDIPPSYRVDLEQLNKNYLQLQKIIHPDNFATKSSREKLYASHNASLCNQAFETLKDPLKRGYYLLTLLGFEHGDQEGYTFTDPDILINALMEQESLETATDLEHIQRCLHAAQEKLRLYDDATQRAFQEREFETALTCLRRYKYQQKFVERALQRLNQMKH